MGRKVLVIENEEAWRTTAIIAGQGIIEAPKTLNGVISALQTIKYQAIMTNLAFNCWDDERYKFRIMDGIDLIQQLRQGTIGELNKETVAYGISKVLFPVHGIVKSDLGNVGLRLEASKPRSVEDFKKCLDYVLIDSSKT